MNHEMFVQKALHTLDDYFSPLSMRGGSHVYFYRIACYHPEVEAFIRRYYAQSRISGALIEGKLANPDEKNLAYFSEIMGLQFQLDYTFFDASLKKWLPRMQKVPREDLATTLFNLLSEMQHNGKSEDMLKNAYIKFMCWFYYRFESVLNRLSNDVIPKILYEGTVTGYELKLFSVLSNIGCDILLLQYHGDNDYLKIDPTSSVSRLYVCTQPGAFPPDYCIGQIQKELEQQAKLRSLYGSSPLLTNCTTAWCDGSGLSDVLKPYNARGNDSQLFYNCFYRMRGVQDKGTYATELYQFQLQLKNSGRKFVIVEKRISPPTVEEIAAIRRQEATDFEQILALLSSNIKFPSNLTLQQLFIKAFLNIMLLQSKEPNMNRNKLTNCAVYLLCWLKRYQNTLFAGWKAPNIACFLFLGGCKSNAEAAFLRVLAQLPTDVVLFVPDLNDSCCLSDPILLEVKETESLTLSEFPCDDQLVPISTVAFHAQQELDTLLFQNSGLYRNQQYRQAVSISLQTTYEEIAILWNQDIKYRPTFSVVQDTVTIPVLFAKISGVKERQLAPYWSSVKSLITENTIVIKNVSMVEETAPSPISTSVVEFLKNRRLQKQKIQNHRAYPYGFLRDEVQIHILNRLQVLLDEQLIKGTFENGTEYTILSTVLNIPKKILQLLQAFDFTKKNPKLVYIHTIDREISLKDSILCAFLNLVGFDILFFVPTGYQTIETHFSKKIIQEHQLGDYLYDLAVPDFQNSAAGTIHKWREKLFGLI